MKRRVYVPSWQVEVGLPASASSPFPFDRVGGHPRGLPAERWPRCRACGEAMSFIGQFAHHAERLPIGEGLGLFAFLCRQSFSEEVDCGLSSPVPESGANAVVIAPLTSQNLERNESTPPAVCTGLSVHSWTEGEETIDDRDAPFALYGKRSTPTDPAQWARLASRIDIERGTKLGGIPSWIQEPTFPEGFTAIGQWADTFRLAAPPLPKDVFTPWVEEPATGPGTEPIDSHRQLGGSLFQLRVFPGADAFLIDGTLLRPEPDGTYRAFGTDVLMGMIYLLRHEDGRFALQWFAR